MAQTLSYSASKSSSFSFFFHSQILGFAHHNWWLQCRTLNPLLVRIHPHSNCFPTLILVVLRAWPIAHQHQLATVLTSRLCELQSQKITMEGDFGNVPTTRWESIFYLRFLHMYLCINIFLVALHFSIDYMLSSYA